MADHRGLIMFVAFMSSFMVTCHGGGLFSKLNETLTVSSSQIGKGYEAGKDQISVTWGLNSSKAEVDTAKYKNVEVKLCYSAESQEDRPWRKTVDDMDRDKTCQFTIAEAKYSSKDKTVTYTVKKDIPSAKYFLRAYVLDGPSGNPVAYGETDRDGPYITIKGISGRSTSIDVAASVFSAFSVLSLVFFYFMEKRRAKRAA